MLVKKVVFDLTAIHLPTNPLEFVGFLNEKIKEIPEHLLYDENTTIDLDCNELDGWLTPTLSISYIAEEDEQC